MRDLLRTSRLIFFAVSQVLLLTSLATAQDSQPVPQFRNYPATSPALWVAGPVDFSTPEVRKYRTRITEASKQWANFAGHHVLVTWGCGTQCQTGAILNLPTGKVTFLPAICCWGDVDDKFKPVEFRKESRLVVLSGQINEQGDNAAHFFEFKDGVLNLLSSNLRAIRPEIASPATSQAPAATSQASGGQQLSPSSSKSGSIEDTAADRDATFLKAFEQMIVVREAAAASAIAWPAEYTGVIRDIQGIGKFDNFRQTQLALSFLLRGAVTVPIQSTRSGSVFVLYNPVLDVGLVLAFKAGAPHAPTRGGLFPGEILRAQRIEGVGPAWTRKGTLVDNVQYAASELRKSNAVSYGSATSSLDPVADYSKTLAANKQFLTLARDRLLLGAMFASNTGLACGERIDAVAGTVEQIRTSVAPVPVAIAVEAGADTSTYAVGGATDETRGVKIYALKKNPYVLIAVWFNKQSETCNVTEAVPMSVFGY
jgi:hypothetical protein